MALIMMTAMSSLTPSSTTTRLTCLSPPSPTSTWLRTTHIAPPHGVSISTNNNNTRELVVVYNSKGPSSGTKEQKWVHEGLIVESLPNGMFRVRLDNDDVILGYISGRIRKSFVRVLPGDRVKVEVSRYDSSKGRITYRLRTSKDPPTS